AVRRRHHGRPAGHACRAGRLLGQPAHGRASGGGAMSGTTILVAAIAFWLAAWYANTRLAALRVRTPAVASAVNLAIPILFGAALLALWEGVTRGFEVPTVLLPPPSMIWDRIVNSVPTLWADFRQTYL